jgi:Na+/H+ antiporter NhaC
MVELIVGTYDETGEFVLSGVLSDPWNAQVLIIVTLLGGLIGLMVRSGGAKAFGDLLGGKIRTKTGAQVATRIIGIVIFFDDCFNALTNGAVMRPISDKYAVSREKLSCIIDSTAVGVCLIAPLSGWVAFVCSLIAEAYVSAGLEGYAFAAFVRTQETGRLCDKTFSGGGADEESLNLPSGKPTHTIHTNTPPHAFLREILPTP